MKNTIEWYKDLGAAFAAKIESEMKLHKHVPLIIGIVDSNGNINTIDGSTIKNINDVAVQ